MSWTTRLSSTALTVALFSLILLHLKHTTNDSSDRHFIVDKLMKTADSCKLFHTFTTLRAKESALTLLHQYLYSLYACPLVNETENSKKSEKFNFKWFEVNFTVTY